MKERKIKKPIMLIKAKNLGNIDAQEGTKIWGNIDVQDWRKNQVTLTAKEGKKNWQATDVQV